MNSHSYFIKTLFRMLTVLINLLMFLKGAPVPIEHLPMKRIQVGLLEDHRPEKFRKMEGYTDLVRNVMMFFGRVYPREGRLFHGEGAYLPVLFRVKCLFKIYVRLFPGVV